MPTLDLIELISNNSNFPVINASEQNTVDGQFTLSFSLKVDPTLQEEDSEDDFSFDLELVNTGGTATFGKDYSLFVLNGTEELNFTNINSFVPLQDLPLYFVFGSIAGTEEYLGLITLLVKPIDDSFVELDSETLDLELKLTVKNSNNQEDNITFSGSDILTISDNEPTISISNYTPVIYETAVDFGNAASFDGIDDYVESQPSNFPTTEITLEGWFKRTDNQGLGTPLLSYASSDSNNNEVLLYEQISTNSILVSIGNRSIDTNIAIPDEDWHHWAVTWRSSDGQVLLYRDGTQVFSGNVSQGDVLASGGTLVLGQEQDSVGGGFASDQTYAGLVDEFRIWNTARTQSQIQDNLYQKLDGTENNLVAYYNFDEDSVDGNTISDITDNANNGTLTNGDETNFVDSEIPTFQGYVDIELNNEVTNQPGITLNYQIESDSTATQDKDFYNSQTDVSTTDSEPQTDSIFIAEGEDSARIYLTALPDAVVEGDENIKLTLLPDFNKALDLDGVDDYVDYGTSLLNNLTEFTIEGWFNTGSIGSKRLDLWGQNDSIEIFIQSNGTLRVWTDETLGQTFNVNLSNNEWYHLAVAGSSTGVEVYLNGSSIGSITDNNISSYGNSSYTTKIGAGVSNASGNNFDGQIDEVRIWNTARTETEIQDTLYATLNGDEANLVAYYNFNDDSVDGNTISDRTANSNNGTLVTNNKVLSLDGSNDYVQIANSNGGFADFSTSKFSIELWFKTDDSGGFLIGSGNIGSDFWQVYIEDGKAKFNFDTGGNNNAAASSNDTVNDNQWHHLVAVRDGNRSGKLYLDGELVDSLSFGNNSSIESHSDVYIGKYGVGNNNYYAGEIDEIKIWNYALSGTEVETNYSAISFDETNSNLKAYYNFDNSNANDLSSSNNGTVNGASFVESGVFTQNLINSLAYDPFATNGATYGIQSTQSAEITIQDSDAYTPGIVIADEYGDEVTADNPLVEDASGNVTFSLKLNSEPTDSVDLSISNSPISTDWDEWKEFTVSASTTITVTSSDSNYNGINPTIYTTDASDTIKLKITEAEVIEEEEGGGGASTPPVETGEDDTPSTSETPEPTGGLEFAQPTTVTTGGTGTQSTETVYSDISTSTLTTSEDGDTVEFAVRLTSAPNVDVTVTLDINDETEGTFEDGSTSRSITIAPQNWDTYQTVTVKGVNDFLFDGDTEYSITASTSSSDSEYDGLTSDYVFVTNQDNETSDLNGELITNLGDVVASLRVDESNSTITEGNTGTFTVELSQAPTQDTVVQYQVINNSATSGDDFTALTGEVTVLAGKTSATIDLASLDDFIDEDSETVEIQLVSPFTNVDVFVETAYSATDNTIGLKLASGTNDIRISPGDELVFSNGAIATVDFTNTDSSETLITITDDAVTSVNVILDTGTGVSTIDTEASTIVPVPKDAFDLVVTTAYDEADGIVGLQLNEVGAALALAPGDEIVFSNSNDGTSITVIVNSDDAVALSNGEEVFVPVALQNISTPVLDTSYISTVNTEDDFDLVVTTAYEETTETVGLLLNVDGAFLRVFPGDEFVFNNDDGSSVTVIIGGTNGFTLSSIKEILAPVTLKSTKVLNTNYTSPVYTGDYVIDEAADNFSDTITIEDNDTAKVLITSDAAGTNEISSLTTDESTGTAQTFYVQLDSKPTDDNHVTVYLGTNDTEEGLLSDDDETSEELVKLVFSPSDWNTAQAVTINPINDDIDEVDNENNYQIISTVISDDVKYNEDNVVLTVNGDFDASSNTKISLNLESLTITTTEIKAGTQLSFANGMVLEVLSDTTLTNSVTTDVSVTPVTQANKISVDTTTIIDHDVDNSTEYVTLIVTEEYADGTVELQIHEDSTVTSVSLGAAQQLTFSNGAVFTLDSTSAVTLTNSAATVVNGTLNGNLVKVAITEVAVGTTAEITTDITDENSGITEIIVEKDYNAAAETINLKINDSSATSVDLFAGTQINFNNGAAVILDENVTLTTSASTVNVSGVDNEITTSFTETISTDITVTNTDDDIAGITITASNPIAAEGVGTNSVSVQLDSKPLGEVEVTFNPSNDDIQLNDEFDGESTTITFDADNWDTRQTVTVTAVDDYYVEYDHSSTISVDVSSDDLIYDALTSPSDIEIKIVDNDLPVASIQAIAPAVEAGTPGYFIVALDNPAPAGFDGTGIVINYTVSGTADTDGTGDTDDLKPFTGSVRIAPGETRSPIIAFPIDDFIVEYQDGTKDSVIIELTVTEEDDYQLNDANTATLEIEDNDEAGIRIIEVGTTTVTENQTTEYYISLLSQPVEDVEITISNLPTEQELTVTAVSGNEVTLKLAGTATAEALSLLSGKTLTLNNSTYTVSEDYFIDDNEVTVTLDNTNGISVNDNLTYSYEELSIANNVLTFNSDNWYKLQTVTIEGIDDNVVETGDFHTSSIQYSVAGDSTYDGFAVDDQTIRIIDRTFDKDNTTESLTEGFLGLQDAIDNISLPIVGDLSNVSPSFLEDFLDNLIDEVKATDEVTAETLADAFNNAFDTTITDTSFSGEAFTIDVDITDLSEENIEFALAISGAIGDTIDISGDLGLPALGIGIETTGGGEFNLDYGIDLAFGIKKDDGFYINTEDTSFAVGANLGLTDDFSATGKLAFLQLDIEDGDTAGTGVDAEFLATLTNPNDEEDTELSLSELNAARDGDVSDLINYSFSGDATLDLDVETSFAGDTAFPSFDFNIYSAMPIFNYGNADDEEEVSGATLTIDEIATRNTNGNITVSENSSTTLAVTATDTDSDIRLTKGTKLTFNGDEVVVSKTKTISPDSNPENILVEVADDGNTTTKTVTLQEGETAELESGAFNISFNDITLDLGEFVTDLMSPIISYVDELIEPFKPIIDVLQTEIELLDSLDLVDTFDENGDGAATIIEVASTLATLYSGGKNTLKYDKFFSAVTGIIGLVETVEELSNLGSDTLQIDFGEYTLENFNGASEEEEASTIDTESNGERINSGEDALTEAKNTGNSTVTNFFNKLDELGIGIPLLEDPFTAINLLLGQDIDLVTYDIPELDIGFDISQEFPIFGTIKGLLEGGFSLYSDLVVGFDTYGLSQWKELDFALEDSYLISDGFYLSDVDPDTGEDVDELTLDATIAAGVSASAVVAKAEVKGGITGTAALDIIDVGEFTGTSDGKLRGSEVLEADSLLDLFSLSGSLDAFVKALVKVGIDVGFFEIMKTVWSEEFSVTLFEFELGNSPGTLSQSYIEGATVFFDSNLNGILEEGEPVTTSNADGSYNLKVPLLFFDTNDNGKIDPEEGRIVTEGGTDSSSGIAYETPFIAPYGSRMVTPLTTLKQKLIEDGSTSEEAEELIKEALDLPEDIKLEQFDSLAAMSKGDERGTKVYKAHVQMQSLFTQTSEYIKGFGKDELVDEKRPIPEQAIEAIAKGIGKRKGKPPTNFSDSAELEELIKEPLEGKFKPNPGKRPQRLPESFGILTQTVASGNKEIEEVFKGVPPQDILGKVAPVKQITQDKLPKQLRKLAGGGARREDVTNLLERVPDAEQFLLKEQSQPGDKPPMENDDKNPLPVVDSEDDTIIPIAPRKPKKLVKGKRPRNLLELDGDDLTDTKIKFSLSSKNLPEGRIHEIAIFTTEDEEGTINGINPEDENYKQAALNKARSIFSILPDDFIANPKRIMKGFADKNIGFLLIKNGTVDSARRGRTPLDSVLLGSETQGDSFRRMQISEKSENSFRLSFEDGMGDADFTDIVIDAELTDETPEIGTDIQGESEGEMLDLRDYAGKQIQIQAPIVREESEYENVVGFYVVEDENGAVRDPLTGNLINPGEEGYIKAALRNSQNNAFQMGEKGIGGSKEIKGGQIFAPFAIADGTLEEVLDDNPDNDPQVYFAHIGANTDGVDHIRNLGGNTWGVEDMLGGGDMDFNDIVFKLDVTVR